MALLITNINYLLGTRIGEKPLRGKELAELPFIRNAYLYLEGDRIAETGPLEELDRDRFKGIEQYDAGGGTVLPAWCDSHTHLVFPESRESEFVDKINGLSYAEIAARGGGILNSASKMNLYTEDQLLADAWKRLTECIGLGTGAIEIKSGYGLSVDNELKMLRVIKKLKQKSPIPIRATFLGAHAFPREYKEDHEGYIRLLTEEMLPRIVAENLADYIDVFCEKGFFSPEETTRIGEAGLAYGLKPRLHVNQLNSQGGIETGARLGAVSLDHLETVTDQDIKILAGQPEPNSGKSFTGISTLLPTAAFFLRMPFQPARQIIDAGAAVALASDYNPGSSPSGNMNLVVSMACIGMRMTPEEAINAATINGAHALEWGQELGSIAPGKVANLILTHPIPSYAYLPYAFGSNNIHRVVVAGQLH